MEEILTESALSDSWPLCQYFVILWLKAEVTKKVSRNSEINQSMTEFLSKAQEVSTLLVSGAPGAALKGQRTSHTVLSLGGIRPRYSPLSQPKKTCSNTSSLAKASSSRQKISSGTCPICCSHPFFVRFYHIISVEHNCHLPEQEPNSHSELG